MDSCRIESVICNRQAREENGPEEEDDFGIERQEEQEGGHLPNILD